MGWTEAVSAQTDALPAGWWRRPRTRALVVRLGDASSRGLERDPLRGSRLRGSRAIRRHVSPGLRRRVRNRSVDVHVSVPGEVGARAEEPQSCPSPNSRRTPGSRRGLRRLGPKGPRGSRQPYRSRTSRGGIAPDAAATQRLTHHRRCRFARFTVPGHARDPWATRLPLVPVMKTTDLRDGDHLAGPGLLTARGSGASL